MGFVDGFIRQLTQPADDENEFYDGADESSKPAAKVKPQPVQPQSVPAQPAQAAAQQPASRKANLFERMAASAPAEEAEPVEEDSDVEQAAQGGLLSALGIKVGGGKKQQASAFQAAAAEPSVIIFAPKSMLEARDLRDYLLRGQQTIATLDNVSDADARRILDYMSGIVFAMDATITQISTRAFIIVPGNVNIKVNGQV